MSRLHIASMTVGICVVVVSSGRAHDCKLCGRRLIWSKDVSFDAQKSILKEKHWKGFAMGYSD